MPFRLLKSMLMSFVLLIAGCQTTQKNNIDPYEGYNRVVFGVNKGFDTVLVKPVSYVYIKYLPSPIQYGIGNFFDNIREVTNIANDLLQLKFAYMMHDTSRFVINSTIGIFGIFDTASALGLEHRKEDFGQTLYHWGYEESAYIILPFLGPSTIRDTIGLGVDFYALSIWPWINSDWRYAMLTLDYIDIRARILRKESVLDAVTLDEYVFMRNAYFQHRQFLFKEQETTDDVSNGDPYNDIFKADSKTETSTTTTENVDKKSTNGKETTVETTAKKDKATQNGKLAKQSKTDKDTKTTAATTSSKEKNVKVKATETKAAKETKATNEPSKSIESTKETKHSKDSKDTKEVKGTLPLRSASTSAHPGS